MSQEIFEIVKQMNLDNLEVQIALQCAPLISGLRFSNLFNVNNEQADYLISLMNEMHISWKILFRGKEKLTMLLYKKDILENYFSDIRVKNILKNSGYEKNIVDEEDISEQSEPVLVKISGHCEPEILVYNKYYHVWDTSDSDDYSCNISDDDLWMPIPSFDEILEANRDVLERIKEKGD